MRTRHINKNHVLIFTLGYLLLMFVGISVCLNFFLDAMNAKTIQSNVRTQVSSLEQWIDSIAQSNLEQASLFSQHPAIIEQYRTALSGNIDDPESPQAQTARENLREIMEPFQAGFGKYAEGKYQLHFHLPNVRSLLRVWRKVQLDDGRDISFDISRFRQMVIDVNRDQQPAKGIEIGKAGFVIRGVAPVWDENEQHLGSVEFLTPFSRLFARLQESGDTQYALYMNQSLLEIATNLNNPEKHPIVFDDFVFVSSTNSDLFAAHITPDSLRQGQQGLSQPIKDGGFIIFSFPLKDYQGGQIGVLAIARDLTSLNAVSNQVTWQMVAIVSVAILLLALIIFWIMRRFYSLMQQLSSDISQSVVSLRTSSQDFSNSAQQLSQRTSAQAASLEQTSSGLTEIETMTKSNADTSLGVNQIAKEASEEMQQLSIAMSEINEASRGIAGITKTIDGLAFQTNILSLNAAVEAARAGEAGLGFAVVADEVRNLALRSAEAAQDITHHVDNNIQKASAAVGITDAVIQTFENIKQQIDEISAASQEQTQGLHQISQAISQLDQLTQKNASQAETNAHNSIQLNEQITTLQHIIQGLIVIVGESKDRQPIAPAIEVNPNPQATKELALVSKDSY